MKELLELLQKKESEIDNGLMSIRMFTDGIGFIIDETQTEIFEFRDYDELFRYLTNKL